MLSLKGESALLGDDNPNKSQIKGNLNFEHHAKKVLFFMLLVQAAHVKATWGKR